MPKSSGPKKRYVPKAVYPPFRYSAELETMLALRPFVALNAISRGEGNTEDWRTIAIRLNLAEALLFGVFEGNEEGRTVILRAMEATADLWARYKQTGSMVLTGQQLGHLREGLHLADELQGKTTRVEQAKALRDVHELNRKLARRTRVGTKLTV